MGTAENLQSAFAGESQANRKYLAFAQKAQADGYAQIAKLFRAAAEAETVHALAHLRVMGQGQNTIENLKAAIDGEGYEFKHMYPEFIAEAEKEGSKAALRSFRLANAVEEVHYNLYSQALESVKGDRDLDAAPIYVCQYCGNTVIGEIPETCPVCGAKAEAFHEVK